MCHKTRLLSASPPLRAPRTHESSSEICEVQRLASSIVPLSHMLDRIPARAQQLPVTSYRCANFFFILWLFSSQIVIAVSFRECLGPASSTTITNSRCACHVPRLDQSGPLHVSTPLFYLCIRVPVFNFLHLSVSLAHAKTKENHTWT